MKRHGPKNHPRPGLPLVNLLSPSAFDVLNARKLRHRFLAGGAALIVLIGGLWAVQHLRVGETQKAVAVEQAETTRLNSDTHLLLPVKAFVAGVAAQKQTVDTTMQREIFFSQVLSGIQGSTPAGAKLESIAVTLAAPAAAGTAGVPAVSPCPGPDPFQTRTVIGCVTLAGTASSRADVGRLVITLGHDDRFVEPFISTTTTADGAGVSFSGSVGLSEAVYSKRYGNPVATGATP